MTGYVDPWAGANQTTQTLAALGGQIDQDRRMKLAEQQQAQQSQLQGLQMAKAQAEMAEVRRNQKVEEGARAALAAAQPQASPTMLAGLGAANTPLPQPEQATPPNHDKVLLDYYAKNDLEKYAGMQKLMLDKYKALAEINPESAVEWYNQVTGQQLKYAGKKGDYSIVRTPDGTIVAVNTKDPKDVQMVQEGTPKDNKGFDTIDLGDKVKIIPRDGSAPYFEKKAASPNTVIKLQGGGGSGGGGVSRGKPPIGYRYTPNGDLEPIPGGPADQKVTAASKAQGGAVQAINTAITSAEELLNHPGRGSATGLSSVTNFAALPGGDAKTFLTKLDTFKSQMFVPMVQQLRGMGQLSDAEGKRLVAAIGALEPSMGEKAFVSSLQQIVSELEMTKERTAKPISGATTGREALRQTKQIDTNTAQRFLRQAGGNKDKARELARKAGYSF